MNLWNASSPNAYTHKESGYYVVWLPKDHEYTEFYAGFTPTGKRVSKGDVKEKVFEECLAHWNVHRGTSA
jgi:hypothetical protein